MELDGEEEKWGGAERPLLADFNDVQYRPASPLARMLYPPFTIERKVLEAFEEENGVQVVVPEAAPRYTHPLLWLYREMLTEDLIWMVRHEWAIHTNPNHHCFVMDVGSNLVAIREKADDLPVWGNMPELIPGDTRRRRAARGMVDWCSCLSQECNCVLEGRRFAYIAINSIYYLDAEEVATLCRRCTSGQVYALVVLQKAMFGSICGEMRWTTDAFLNQTTHVKGEGEPYVHPRQQHIYSERVDLASGGQLVRSIVKTVQHHAILQYSLSDVIVHPQVPVTWNDVFTAVECEGEVYNRWTRSDPATYLPMIAELDLHRLVLVGDGAVLFSGTSKRVLVDRRVLQACATYALNRARGKNLYGDLIWKATNAYQNANMPVDYLRETVQATAIMAMSQGLDEESAALDALQHRWTAAFKLHEALISFLPVQRTHICVVVGCLICVLVGLIVVAYYDPSPHKVVALGLACVFCAFVAYGLCLVRRRNRHQDAGRVVWETAVNNGAVASYSGAISNSYPATSVAKVVDTVRRGLQLRVTREALPDKKPKILRAWGVTFSKHVPSVFGSTQENEIAGIQARIGGVLPERNQELDDAFRRWAFEESDFADPTLLVDRRSWRNPSTFIPWLQSRNAYTAEFKARLMEVWHRIKTVEAWDPAWNKISGFVKLEMACGKRDLDGPLPGKPRIIQGGSPEMIVVLAIAFMVLFSAWSVVFDGRPLQNRRKKLQTYWAPGRSADKLGKHVQAMEEAIPDGVWFEGDYEWFDGHYTKQDRIDDGRVAYEQLEAIDWVQFNAFIQHHPAGQTHQGVAYSTVDGLCSGEPGTTVIGTKRDAELLEFAIEKVYNVRYPLKAVGYCLMVGGDDNIGRIENVDPEHFKVEMRKIILELGYHITLQIRRHLAMVEFYSKVFWPVNDPDQKYVLGPKPGRCLTKVGWSLAVPNRMNPRAVYVSLAQDARHVPFVAEFVEQTKQFIDIKVRAKYAYDYDYMVHTSKAYAPHPTMTRVWVRERYGLELDDALARFAMELSEAKTVPCTILSGVMDRLCEVDVDEPTTVLGLTVQ